MLRDFHEPARAVRRWQSQTPQPRPQKRGLARDPSHSFLLQTLSRRYIRGPSLAILSVRYRHIHLNYVLPSKGEAILITSVKKNSNFCN